MDLRQGWSLARQAYDAWSDDYAPSMGAALSYYTLFSIAPVGLILRHILTVPYSCAGTFENCN